MTSPYHPAPQDPIPESTPPAADPAESAPAEAGDGAVHQPVPPVNYLQSAGTPAYAAAPPVAPAPVYRYPASSLHAGIRAGIGGVLILAAVVSGVFGNMFPYNAPVESILNFGLIIVLVAAGATLLIFAGLTVSRMSRPTIPGRTSPLAITGFVLTAIAFVAWAFSMFASVTDLIDGDRLRFMNLTGMLFALGFVWGTGLVMGALSIRAVGGKSRLFAILAVCLGMVLVIAAVVPAVIYGLALTD